MTYEVIFNKNDMNPGWTPRYYVCYHFSLRSDERSESDQNEMSVTCLLLCHVI